MITRQGYFPDGTLGSATFSADGRYRYCLTRSWDASSPQLPIVFIGLNPSAANESVQDPTIIRCTGFAKREGCGGLVMLNVFALCSADPKALLQGPATGPYNLETIRGQCQPLGGRQPVVVAAWGAYAGHMLLRPGTVQVEHTLRAIGVKLSCLGTTKDGYPRHPLYLRTSTPLVPYPGA
jgi:hypothetical protein